MKQALLTGSAGFVGQHMRERLLNDGYEVHCLDIKNSWREDCLEFFKYDRRKFDLAIHCAANIKGRVGIDGSPLAIATNLALDSWYLQWLVRSKTERAVYFSSSAIYPTSYQAEHTPKALYEPMAEVGSIKSSDAAYGRVKNTIESFIGYAITEGVKLHIFRPASGYCGWTQSLDYPFPALAQRVRERQSPLTIWGDPTSQRDWIHISDIVGAVFAAIDQDRYNEPINLSTGIGTSFYDLAQMMASAAEYHPEIKAIEGPMGVHTRVLDSSRMREFYEPKISLEEGVRMAVADAP